MLLPPCNNPNVAVETTIGQKSTINFDVLASFGNLMENRGSFTPLQQNTDIISKLLIADFMLVDTLGLLYFVFKMELSKYRFI
jgi:hypothetical protein